MQIFRSLAGYSLGRADIVRRAMSKKKHDVMKREREAFIFGELNPDGTENCKGAVKMGVDQRVAEKIFDDMDAFAQYAFNKSHATAYGVGVLLCLFQISNGFFVCNHVRHCGGSSENGFF